MLLGPCFQQPKMVNLLASLFDMQQANPCNLSDVSSWVLSLNIHIHTTLRGTTYLEAGFQAAPPLGVMPHIPCARCMPCVGGAQKVCQEILLRMAAVLLCIHALCAVHLHGSPIPHCWHCLRFATLRWPAAVLCCSIISNTC